MKAKVPVATVAVFLALFSVALCQTEKAEAPGASAPRKPAKKRLRDPFWPDGYWPKAPEAETAAKKPPLRRPGKPKPPPVKKFVPNWPALKVKAITDSRNGTFAIFEGIKGVVKEGNVIGIRRDGAIYRWRIDEITEKGVRHTRLNAKPIEKKTVPLTTK